MPVLAQLADVSTEHRATAVRTASAWSRRHLSDRFMGAFSA
ncbi:hypothetical protein [Saccharothrix obliqua]|nr:hypothetical protein [Saccharothrix obliqua]